jgi:hypothetical protein
VSEPGDSTERDDGAEREDRRPGARERPPDPAGTRPRHEPESLLPARRVVAPSHEVVDSTAVEENTAPPALLPERRASAGAVGAATAREAPFAPRFQFLFGALAALGAAAVTALVLAIGAGGGDDGRQDGWSRWEPTASGLDGARQIAQHVAVQYRFGNGRQIVNVEASPLQINGVPLAVALREGQAQGGDIEVFGGDGLIFRFCGLGPNCAISAGKATTERHLLLRREALEIALYSFHYLDGIEQIVVFMPPRKGKKPNQAFFIRKGDLGAQLDRPLTASLAPRAPTTRDVTLSPDVPLVQRLTLPNLFTFSLTQANTDNRGFIVLDPLPAASTSPSAPAPRPSGRS